MIGVYPPKPTNARFLDLTGHKYGRWEVLRYAGKKNNAAKPTMWCCRCECGTEKVVVGTQLRTGDSKSCGCWNREVAANRHRTHDMTGSDEYRIWCAMKSRCRRGNHKHTERYANRGIFVCDRWANSFQDFYKDMGPRPSKRHSIDRINNDGPYCPDNCRWTTIDQQARNTRRNHLITHDGATMCMQDWADHTELSFGAIKQRLKRGWSVSDALTLPIGSRRPRNAS